MINIKKNWPVILILAVSLTTHFVFFGYPKETVFDEVHFGKFISGYFTQEYFFDIHPPLGKLLISGMGYLTGFEPSFSFASIGEGFPDTKYLWLRFLPTLAGSLLAVIIYLLAFRLGLSRRASLAIAILLAIENSLIVQSRFILLDAFLLLFGFTALYLYFSQRGILPTQKNKNRWYLFTAGLFASMAISIKWTGLSFLGIIILIELFDLWKSAGWRMNASVKKRLFAVFLYFIIVPTIIYFSTFVIHLKLLTKSGPGDAFMTLEFQKTLTGNSNELSPDIKPLNMLQKIIELNKEMYQSNASLTATHPYSSEWYTWPFMQRPIYYWHKSNSISATDQAITPLPTDSRIYFMGNPVIWFFSTLAIFYLIFDQLINLYLKKKIDFLPRLIIGGYILNILPFIGIARVMFLYHYMIGYIFALFALVYLIDQIPQHMGLLKSKTTVLAVVIIAGAVSFLYFSPLTYGTPLTTQAYNLRVWLPSWR